MSRSLHHSFDIALANEFSIEEAIIIHHFQHWIQVNKNLKKNFVDGKTWTYQTQDWITAHFPYWNKFQVHRIIQKLVEKNVLQIGNYNKNKYDQTNWYAFVDEKKYVPDIERLQNCNMDSHREIAKMQHRNHESATPIPDTKTNTKDPPLPLTPSPSFSSKSLKEEQEEEEDSFTDEEYEEAKEVYLAQIAKGIEITLPDEYIKKVIINKRKKMQIEEQTPKKPEYIEPTPEELEIRALKFVYGENYHEFIEQRDKGPSLG